MSLFRLSEILYKEGKLADALSKFNNFITIYPASDLIPKAKEYVDKITAQLETVDVSNDS